MADYNYYKRWTYRGALSIFAFTFSGMLLYGETIYAKQYQHEVSGRVTNSDGDPLPGATVVIQGTLVGAATDFDGNYQIMAAPNSILVFSFVGYQSQPVAVDGRSRIDVVLETGIGLLDEVVVTGYGIQRRDELTGSISVVEPEDIRAVVTHNPLQALQGRVAGLHITRDGTPGGGTRSALIRGLNTLGDNEPLFIIDGQPVGRDKFDLLNANDIESLQVLKDASAASIYGSRASNGVIIVTTRQAQPGDLRIEVNSRTSLQRQYPHINVLNTRQRGEVLWRASVNDGQDPNNHAHYNYDWRYDENGAPMLHDIQVVDWLDENVQGGIRAADTDWFNMVSRPGYITENNISLTSGSDTHSLMVSLGHHYHQGVVKYNNFERLSLRVNSRFDLLEGRLSIGENLQLATTDQTPHLDHVFGGPPIRLAQRQLPILPVYAEDGTFAGPIGAGMSDRMNPLAAATFDRDNAEDITSAFGSLYLEYSLLDNLVFNSNLGVDYHNSALTRIRPEFQTGFLARSPNSLEKITRNTTEWTWFNTLTYDFDIGEHRTNLLAGIEATRSDFEFVRAYREEFLLESLDFLHLDAGSGSTEVNGGGSGFRLFSYFSKANYAYSNRYLASVTLRYDGSSRFGAENRFGFFPAFSVGWRISNENFFMNAESLDFISQLTIRAGAGRTGNQRIDNEAPFAKFIPGYGRARFLCCDAFGRPTGSAYDITGAKMGSLPSGVIRVQTANPNLRWEATDEVNVGIDFGFLEQRFTGSFDLFWRETKDILVLPPRLAVLGEGADMWENGATMENRGWELTLGYNERIGSVGFQLNASVGSFKDKITFLPDAVIRAFPGNVEKTILGRSITSNFGYVTDGIFQNQAEVDAHAVQPGKGVGRLRFKDLDGDGRITVQDQDWLGDQLPDFEYGLSGLINYRQFSLSFFLSGVQGVERHNFRKDMDFIGRWSGENYTTRTLRAWTPENPNSDIPALSLTDANNEARMSNYHIENMSYLKLKNLRLGYTLPLELQQRLGMYRAEVFVAGQELLTITSREFTGADPENPGDFYPLPRTFTLGFNVAF